MLRLGSFVRADNKWCPVNSSSLIGAATPCRVTVKNIRDPVSSDVTIIFVTGMDSMIFSMGVQRNNEVKSMGGGTFGDRY